MSKQSGLIKVEGNIDGVSFYKMNGNNYARMKGGVSKGRIQKDPAYQRTRENNVEFTGSATATKSIRQGLLPVLAYKADNQMSTRMNIIMRDMLKKGTGVRGQRAVQLSANKTMFEGFEFDDTLSFTSTFLAPFTVAPNAARNQCVITVPSFFAAASIKAPAGATHFRLVSALTVESDYTYNASNKRYEPTDVALNQLSVFVYSPTTPLASTTAATLTLTATLPGATAPTITATVSVIQCLGIEFFQRIGTVDYPLVATNCIKIVKVF